MRRLINILLAMLLFWFTLNITGFSLGQFCLVEKPGIQSIDTAWWIIFIVCSTFFLLKKKLGTYILSIFLAVWAIIQYFSHWNYTIFGATERKLTGYNNFFKNTYHIIPPSDSILIPDLYHIILHTLIVILLFLIVASMFQNKSKTIS